GVRPGTRLLAPEGRARTDSDRGLLARGTPAGRLRHRLFTPHRQVDTVGDQRPPGLLQRKHVLAYGHRRPRLLREADELPVSHSDIQELVEELPGTADPAG